MSDTTPRAGGYFRDALVDAFAPLLTYLVLHFLGVPPLIALIVGTAVALGTTIMHTIRRKRLDAVGLLVLAEIGVSIVLQMLTMDTRLLMVKPSLYSAIGAVYLTYTAFRDRPLTYEGSRPMATHGDPERLVAYERAWERSPTFRTLHRASTLGWAAAFLVDAILRVVIVYGTPGERAAWLANVPHLVAVILLIGFSAFMGRQTKPFVEEQVRILQEESSAVVAPTPA